MKASWMSGPPIVFHSVPFQLLRTCQDWRKPDKLVHPQTLQPLPCSLTWEPPSQHHTSNTFDTKVNGCLIWKLRPFVVRAWFPLQSKDCIAPAFGRTEIKRKAKCVSMTLVWASKDLKASPKPSKPYFVTLSQSLNHYNASDFPSVKLKC